MKNKRIKIFTVLAIMILMVVNIGVFAGCKNENGSIAVSEMSRAIYDSNQNEVTENAMNIGEKYTMVYKYKVSATNAVGAKLTANFKMDNAIYHGTIVNANIGTTNKMSENNKFGSGVVLTSTINAPEDNVTYDITITIDTEPEKIGESHIDLTFVSNDPNVMISGMYGDNGVAYTAIIKPGEISAPNVKYYNSKLNWTHVDDEVVWYYIYLDGMQEPSYKYKVNDDTPVNAPLSFDIGNILTPEQMLMPHKCTVRAISGNTNYISSPHSKEVYIDAN